MQNEQAREFLERYRTIRTEIEIEQNRLDLLDEASKTISSPNLDGLPRPSGHADRTGDAAAKVLDLLDELDYAESCAEEIRREIESVADEIPKRNKKADGVRQRECLKLRYLDLLTWPKVSKALFGSEPDYEERAESYLRRTTIIHGRALQTIEVVLEERNHENSD